MGVCEVGELTDGFSKKVEILGSHFQSLAFYVFCVLFIRVGHGYFAIADALSRPRSCDKSAASR
jgi:hypothetical protein